MSYERVDVPEEGELIAFDNAGIEFEVDNLATVAGGQIATHIASTKSG